MSQGTVPELLDEVIKAHADSPAYRYKTDGGWEDISWTECRTKISRIARGLMALGVKKGDRVGILGATRLEWLLTDFGISCAGGVTVGIYPSNLAPDCAHIVKHADIEVLLVENADQLAKVVAEREKLPNLREIVIWERDASGNALDWNEFLEKGNTVDAGQLTERSNAIEPDDLASLVYTSGTTGRPQGRDDQPQEPGLHQLVDSPSSRCTAEPHYKTLLFLPLAHVFARMIAYMCMRMSGDHHRLRREHLTKIGENMKEVRPHFILSAPRIYEKVYDKILTKGDEAGSGLKKKLFDWALDVGQRVSTAEADQRPIPAWLALQHTIADKSRVPRRSSDGLGGRLKSGASRARHR